MKLYFENSQGKYRLIAECETVHEAHKEIDKFLDEHNRSWGGEDGITIDVGNHSEFFKIKGISHDDYIKALQEKVDPEEWFCQITFDEYLESLQNS